MMARDVLSLLNNRKGIIFSFTFLFFFFTNLYSTNVQEKINFSAFNSNSKKSNKNSLYLENTNHFLIQGEATKTATNHKVPIPGCFLESRVAYEHYLWSGFKKRSFIILGYFRTIFLFYISIHAP